MDDYITKPIMLEIFKTTLERWISSSDTVLGPAETTPPSSSPLPPVVNEEELLEFLGGDRALLAELSGLFLEEYPKTLAAIQAGVAQKDTRAVYHAAHTLKGSVGNFSAKTVFEAARVLEEMGRKEDLSEAPTVVATLEQELARLQPVLASFAAAIPAE